MRVRQHREAAALSHTHYIQYYDMDDGITSDSALHLHQHRCLPFPAVMHLNSISALCMEHSNSTDSLSLTIAGHLATPPDVDAAYA